MEMFRLKETDSMTTHRNEKPDRYWTIMVYLAGDNNLAEEMVYALKGMYGVGSTANYQVVALYDSGLSPVTFKIPVRTHPPKPALPNANVTENFGLYQKAEGLRRAAKQAIEEAA